MESKQLRAYQEAAMPELFNPMPTEPRIRVMYLAPGHELITPEQVSASEKELLSEEEESYATVAKISPSLVVKFGTHVSLIEARTLLFLAEHTSVPVPKLYAAYAYGPMVFTAESVSGYEIYIFMEYIEGQDLEKVWRQCNASEKQRLSADLRNFISELRSIPAADYIGSVHRGPVTDVLLEWSTGTTGPFNSEDQFNATITEAYVKEKGENFEPYVRGMLNAHRHEIKFTHGDIRPANIIVRQGRVVGIIDWEMAGWYPEYWEFAKAFYFEDFSTDWSSYIPHILSPYYCEQLMYMKLVKVLLWLATGNTMDES